MLKVLTTMLFSIISTVSLAQSDLITITDSQATYLAEEHLAAEQLRKDTAQYNKIVADYRKIFAVDSIQRNFLMNAVDNQQHKIQKLTVANTRWQRLSVVELGVITVAVGFVFGLALIK